MRKNLIILLLVIGAAIGSAVYFRNANPPFQPDYLNQALKVDKKKNVGFKRQELPSFSFKPVGGDKEVTMPEMAAGKIVLLNFWASWCAPCVAEFPILLEVSERFADELIFLGISSDISVKAMQSFFDKVEYEAKTNEMMTLDQGGTITSGVFQTYMLPETILIDQRGNMVKKYVGVDWSKSEMIADIEKLLQ